MRSDGWRRILLSRARRQNAFLPLFKRNIGLGGEYGLALVEAMAHCLHLWHLGQPHARAARGWSLAVAGERSEAMDDEIKTAAEVAEASVIGAGGAGQQDGGPCAEDEAKVSKASVEQEKRGAMGV